MVEEEDQKFKIFNTVHMNTKDNTPKKKYFRIEKSKKDLSTEVHSKAIFRTKKDYNFLNRKTLREIEEQKRNKINNNKFFTTTFDDTTISVQSENSFLVKNIIPRKLILTQENKKDKNNNKQKYSLLQILFKPENNENIQENNKNSKINYIKSNLEKFRLKLMIVYFHSIKNLCKYINKNFFDIAGKENIIVDAFIYQIYQTFRILNMKIIEFKIFSFMKDIFKSKIKKEDFDDILALKHNFQFMRNVLNKTMSDNLIYIYINIDNFCKFFYPSIEQIDELQT
jgi:hypothetical protein